MIGSQSGPGCVTLPSPGPFECCWRLTTAPLLNLRRAADWEGAQPGSLLQNLALDAVESAGIRRSSGLLRHHREAAELRRLLRQVEDRQASRRIDTNNDAGGLQGPERRLIRVSLARSLTRRITAGVAAHPADHQRMDGRRARHRERRGSARNHEECGSDRRLRSREPALGTRPPQANETGALLGRPSGEGATVCIPSRRGQTCPAAPIQTYGAIADRRLRVSRQDFADEPLVALGVNVNGLLLRLAGDRKPLWVPQSSSQAECGSRAELRLSRSVGERLGVTVVWPWLSRLPSFDNGTALWKAVKEHRLRR